MSVRDSGGQLAHHRPPMIPVAKVLKPVGLAGEVRLRLLTDLSGIFEQGSPLFVGECSSAHSIERFDKCNGGRLKLQGIDTREGAELLRGVIIYCDTKRAVPLLKGRYFEFQIIGLRVCTIYGELLGTVVEVIETGANDVYVVRDSSSEILIPATKQIVLKIDLDKSVMTVKLIPGLRGAS